MERFEDIIAGASLMSALKRKRSKNRTPKEEWGNSANIDLT